ncbi:MAG: glycosyltransferase family 4 protein [Halomonas subglaciescola]|nr:glycosyltransferase family 4 protein [Halomonas subglaciescola]
MAQKIMQICLSRGWGGLEMYPARIIPELQRQGAASYGLALEASRVAASMREAGAEVVTVAGAGQALLQLGKLLRYIDRHGIDTLHCHKSSDLRVASLLATFRPSLRLFFTEHMGVKRPKKGLYHRFAYARVVRVFSISQATYQRNIKALPLPAERIHCLGLGVDTTAYDAPLLPRQALKLPAQRDLIALPGRITPGKGHETWLEALALLDRSACWQALIIGGMRAEEGSDEAFVARLKIQISALGLEERVTFMGFRRDLPALLKAVDIVCVPSRNEAFGLTVIEAMAAGSAVVGADSGAIPELIDDSRGRLAEPTSPQAWASALAELLGDAALRERLGEHAKQWVAEHMTLHAHVQKLLSEYRRVA